MCAGGRIKEGLGRLFCDFYTWITLTVSKLVNSTDKTVISVNPHRVLPISLLSLHLKALDPQTDVNIRQFY